MNLNKLDFINFSLMELSKIGADIREETDISEYSRERLGKYISRLIIEKNDKISMYYRFNIIKKVLYTLGMSYPEFHTIYTMLDQEVDSILHGD